MQTTAMLLRSSSTPLLECLALAHPELPPLADAKFECSAGGEAAHAPPMSVSLASSRAGSHLPPNACQPHMHLDSPLIRPSCSESPGSGLPSSNRIRKAQSENDLCSLGAGGSVTPAKVAANTLLHDSLGGGDNCFPCSAFDFHNSTSCLPHVMKKGRALPPLGRRRSLGSLPTELPSVFFHGDSAGGDFAILEELVELTPSCSSAASDTDDEREAGAGIFNKLALPVGRSAGVKKDVDVILGSCGEVQSLDGLQQNTIVPEMWDRQGEMPMVSPQADIDASSSRRWEPVGTFGQSSSMYAMSTRSANMGLAPAKEACEPSLPLRHVYHGEDLEVACNGGGGGRGARPPITGVRGGGGGGDAAGGRGGGGQDVADKHYQYVLQKDPGNPLLLRNYAQYLAEVKHDYRKAEEFFERAILASPGDGELLGQYANMLWEVKHDTDRAATYFERAVRAAPDNSYVMAAYASFLWSSEEEEGQESSGSGPSDFPSSFPSLVSAGLA